ncbi:MAG: acyl-[acyl-carrier-protein] thioesterase [Bacteroidetes bacterium]|nr:acyl-[acyl-carrier-protein] thioesterase [Bacteroidota bacterium]
MLNTVGSYTFTIDAYLSDFRGKATLPMIGGFLLQAASKHAEERGFGYSVMTERGKAWVLSRMYIQICEYPTNETQISVNTWVTDINKLFTERCFSIEDKNGREIGFARSLWAALDVETRRPTNILDLGELTGYICKKTCPIEPISKIGQPKEEAKLRSEFTVQYSDIDINKHLNSMKYIEHFVDVFPIQMYHDKEIRDFNVNYLLEGHYGEKLQVLETGIEPDVFTLTMKNAEKAICLAKVGWAQPVGDTVSLLKTK